MRSRSVLLVVVAGLVVAGMVAAPAAPAASENGTGVFRSAAGSVERSTGRHAIRERLVTIDVAQLSPEARRSGTVVFNLFDDIVVEATAETVDVRGPNDFTWVGDVGGLGYVVITVIDGVAAGRIVDARGRAFTVSYVGDGVHVVTEPDPSSYPREAEPLTPQHVAGTGPVARARAVNTRVDLLVAYTDAAADFRGGRSALEALITNAVTEANLGLEKSGIDVVLRLVDLRQVDYSETGNSSRDLDRLTEPRDGHMDDVHRWRDGSGADMVSLITDNDDVCGIAWTMADLEPGFDSYAFSVVTADCIDWEASLAHELGHNFGANHERGVTSGRTVYPYSYAWVDYDNDFRTIMAYGDFCTPQWTGCPMILRFSSSTKEYSGLPTGDRDNDNARTINNTAATVAGFRSEADDGGGDTCAGLAATHTSADAVDGVITGTRHDDVILGSDGRDIIRGKGGDDVICSLGGRDAVYGNAGNDTIYGGDADDVIEGGGGRDALYGENGDDRLVGNRGRDTGDGGDGTDTCRSIETATSCETGTGTTTTTTVPAGARLDYTLPAAMNVTLPTNFPLPDPRVFDIVSGGDISTAYLNTDPLHRSGDCTGFAIQNPDFELTYAAGMGTQPMLRFWWSSNDGTGDAVLIINAPNGKWYCNDDSFGTNHPTVDFDSPATGVYDVYVASRTAGSGRPGMLRITELSGSHP